MVFKISIILLFLTSCIVQSPKYTSLEKVMSLKIGMTREVVEKQLGITPYNLKARTDSSDVFVYVYQLIDRKTLFLNTKPKNGKETKGKYVQLEVTYTKTEKVTNIESCKLCADNLVTTSKVDFAKIILFVTVTLPVILIYVGLKE